MAALLPRPRAEIAPGAVHVPDWLDLREQRDLVTACHEWSQPPAGLRTTRLPSGGMMSVRTVCLGWHWYPYGYSRTVNDEERTPVKPFPTWLAELGQRAVAEAYDDEAAGQAYRPDIALVNYYDNDAKMGMHQDKDERSQAPVVSLSLGERCVFRFGNTEHRNKPWTDIELSSGDLFVFGGPSRMAYHGVPKIRPGVGDPEIGLPTGRLNITLRESGLT